MLLTGIHTNWFPSSSSITIPFFILSPSTYLNPFGTTIQFPYLSTASTFSDWNAVKVVTNFFFTVTLHSLIIVKLLLETLINAVPWSFAVNSAILLLPVTPLTSTTSVFDELHVNSSFAFSGFISAIIVLLSLYVISILLSIEKLEIFIYSPMLLPPLVTSLIWSNI